MYYNKPEIENEMQSLVDEYLSECTNCKSLPEDFVSLLKHNFLAKFVAYNEENHSIEIGVEQYDSNSQYPEIKIMSYSISDKKKWLKKSFKSNETDLEFYGQLLSRKKTGIYNNEVIVM
ncbi:hypothetical protein L1I30_11825 [Gillisia sp. M10.2A]|uniref:Uncharacterized protein n=1 Tax=Gillisia lutea TaxID=2909668 RepID=A0ABS9EHK2_9FLAO|nr:hypothetical protein [Gillisia lutea]MCF4102357.1 hypothetical protein [Gillisia lutea]